MRKTRPTTSDEIVSFLKATDFFHDIPLKKLHELSTKFEWIDINSGEILIKQGEKGNCLFLVMSGRFAATSTVNEKLVVLNEIGRGELIGELALLTQNPRSVTVVAIRDSILLKLSQESFNDFIQNNPLQLAAFARSAILRLLNTTKPKKHSRINSITLAPADGKIDLSPFTEQFVASLEKFGTVLHLNSQKIKEIFKKECIDNDCNRIANDSKLITWINKSEGEYRYIVYETDPDYTEWTKRCIRQADRILFISDDKNKDLNLIERQVYLDKSIIKKKIDLVFLHEYSKTPPRGTMNWLELRQTKDFHHLRKNLQADMDRLVRIVTGHSIGLILGGGGARALAHVGVYKAMNELGIPVDLVGGTSFGALIGCGIAMDLSIETMIENLKKRVVENRRLFQRTIPILSISSGSHITKGMKDFFGDENRIEDLWKKFFCISCNLTQSKEEVTTTGLVWKAIRSTVSIPVLFPPITNEDNEVFIDGGIMNNLPVDVMRRYVGGGKIIAVSTSVASPLKADIPEGDLSGFKLIYQRYIKGEKASHPNIFRILLKSIGVSSLKHEKAMLESADYAIQIRSAKVDLLDFQAIDQLIESGYRTAIETFDKKTVAELLAFTSGHPTGVSR